MHDSIYFNNANKQKPKSNISYTKITQHANTYYQLSNIRILSINIKVLNSMIRVILGKPKFIGSGPVYTGSSE